MTEEEYRAEMVKQARLANLIALRRLASDNMSVSRAVMPEQLTSKIVELVYD